METWETISEEMFELPKYAAIREEITLYPHQVRARDKAHQNKGNILLVHGTGMGKTATAISIAEDALDQRGAFRLSQGNDTALVITPAGLRVNFVDNVLKFTKRKTEIIDNIKELEFLAGRVQKGMRLPPYLVMSWDLLRFNPELARTLNPRIVLFDEMDAAKDSHSSNYRAARIVRQGVAGAVGMAASFVSNTPDELPKLLSITTDGQVDPNMPLRSMTTTKIDRVETLFGKPKPLYHVDRPDIIQSLGHLLDFADPDESPDMPRAVTEYIPVEMSKDQYGLYQDQMKELPKGMFEKIIRGQWGAGPKNRAMAARQAAQSTYMKYGDTEDTIKSSPKIQRIVEDTKTHLRENPRHQVVIYANFVNAGARPLHRALTDAKIPHSIFIGQGNEVNDEIVNESQRTRAKEDFQSGRTRVILVSGAGAKGLDLKTGTMFAASEGHFNPEIIRQAQARIRRLGAQSDLPPAQRKVLIRRYVSVEPAPGLFGRMARWMKGEPKHYKSTDEWVYDVAKAKHFTNEGVRISLQGRVPLAPGQEPPMSASSALRGPFKYLFRKRHPTQDKWVYTYPKEL